MNQKPGNLNQDDHDELKDRLADLALRELIGGDHARDLSARVTRAVDPRKTARANHLDESSRTGRWRRFAIAACVVAGAGISTWLAWPWLSSRTELSSARQVSIYVAATDIPLGETLTPEMVRLDPRPQEGLPEGVLFRFEELDGRRPRQPLAAGEPILASKLIDSETWLGGALERVPQGDRRDPRATESAAGEPTPQAPAPSAPSPFEASKEDDAASPAGALVERQQPSPTPGPGGGGYAANQPGQPAAGYDAYGGGGGGYPSEGGYGDAGAAPAESKSQAAPAGGYFQDTSGAGGYSYRGDYGAAEDGANGYGIVANEQTRGLRERYGGIAAGAAPGRANRDPSTNWAEPVPAEGGRRFRFGNLPRTEGDGVGPGQPGDQYLQIHENDFVEAQGKRAISTFSIDVDTAAYTNVRQFLLQSRRLPPPDAVRIEEMINYFPYDYPGPATDDEQPFAAHVEVAECPWTPEHRLVRVGIKGKEVEAEQRPLSNLVFLIDVSGSMNQANKLPLVVKGLRKLVGELGENDRVAIVVYASAEGLVLPSTSGDQQEVILNSLDSLRAGGSTAGGAGIQLAYQIALDNHVQGGVNRVVLCTDGDFNVGVTSTAELERMVTRQAKSGVFLTVMGFGRGNLNDAMMEGISNKGNGNYFYVDTLAEAEKVLVQEMSGTLVTIAKDVKIQVEFNPAEVAGYRLIGYENRVMANEDFRDDKKDAGEIGAGHTVTALYEIVPAGREIDRAATPELKYQTPAQLSETAASGDLLTVRLRYKQPDEETATESEFAVKDEGKRFGQASEDFKFTTAVASFGMLLRNSKYKGNATYDSVLEIAEDGSEPDPHGFRAEFLELVRQAMSL